MVRTAASVLSHALRRPDSWILRARLTYFLIDKEEERIGMDFEMLAVSVYEQKKYNCILCVTRQQYHMHRPLSKCPLFQWSQGGFRPTWVLIITIVQTHTLFNKNNLAEKKSRY